MTALVFEEGFEFPPPIPSRCRYSGSLASASSTSSSRLEQPPTPLLPFVSQTSAAPGLAVAYPANRPQAWAWPVLRLTRRQRTVVASSES